MLRWVSLLLIIPCFVSAQQPRTTTPKAKAPDPATLTAAIRDSFYHPDEMSSLNCTVSIDWPALFASLKVTPPAERLKTLSGVNIRFLSVRGKSANITFEWSSGTIDKREQFEEGMKQMLGGWDQMYWPLFATPLIGNAAEITKVEPLADGGAEVYISSPDTKVVVTVDQENLPKHYTVDSPVIKGTMDVRYVPSPKPVAGDLHRISGMDVAERIGTSTINVKIGLDYQEVSEFYIPKNISYDVGGAFALSMEFSGCSVLKGTDALQH